KSRVRNQSQGVVGRIKLAQRKSHRAALVGLERGRIDSVIPGTRAEADGHFRNQGQAEDVLITKNIEPALIDGVGKKLRPTGTVERAILLRAAMSPVERKQISRGSCCNRA